MAQDQTHYLQEFLPAGKRAQCPPVVAEGTEALQRGLGGAQAPAVQPLDFSLHSRKPALGEQSRQGGSRSRSQLLLEEKPGQMALGQEAGNQGQGEKCSLSSFCDLAPRFSGPQFPHL